MSVRKVSGVGVLIILLLVSLGAGEGVVKIGVVDLDQAVSSTDEGRAARDEFERKKREAEAKLQPLTERAKELLKEYEAKRFVLSDDALFQKQLDLAELRNQIENKRREIQGQLEVDRERLVGPLRAKLSGIVEEVGREQGFSLILQRNAPGVMYSREALDITELVIEKFNKKG
ncbi:MAG: OmpH family outer membrane protein, partial [Myxococcota bacterium]